MFHVLPPSPERSICTFMVAAGLVHEERSKVRVKLEMPELIATSGIVVVPTGYVPFGIWMVWPHALPDNSKISIKIAVGIKPPLL